MDGKKVYQIQINGITESVNAVEALNKQLDALDARIKTLETSNVKINATSSGGGSNASALSEEAAIQKEINKLKAEGATLDAKIVAAQDEVYKKVDATKQLYKETIADQKALAAQERLTADAYSNTMQGMKQHLADLKAVINTTDLGDSDQIKKMTQDAGELTKKLKEMEEAYGQFGRNVGNYKSAAEGFKGLTIEVNGVTRSFDNAKQALMTLKKERDTLGIGMGKTSKEFKELDEIVKQLQSDINDMSKSSAAMDNLLDTMESFAAIGTISTGFASLFGADSTEIEKSIQKMVAFQNVLKGIEVINKQIQTREGVGGWIAPFTAQIDKATAKTLVFNRALLGTGTAAKVAAKGINLASKALKGLASMGILIVIEAVISKVMDLVESFNKLSATEKAQKEAEESMSKAYGEGMAKITQYKVKLDSFNGSKKEEKKLVEELNKEFGNTLGTYKTIAEWQDVMKKKSDLYVQSLIKQAKAQAALNSVTAAYAKLMQVQMGIANGDYDGIWNKIFGKSGEARLVEAQREVEQMTKMLEDSQKELEEFNKNNKLGDYSPQIKKNATKTKNAVEEAQKTLSQLEIRLMNEGLNKKLRQLDEEERQTINKLKENGRKTGTAIQQVQRSYAQLRAKEIEEYLRTLEEKINKSAQDIQKIQFEINTNEIKNQISELQNTLEKMSSDQPIRNTLLASTEIKETKKLYKVDDTKIEFARSYENLFRISEATNKADEYYKFLLNYVKDKDKELFQDIADYNQAIYNETDEEQKKVYMKGLEDTFKKVADMVEKEYANELLYVRNYTQKVDQTLSESFAYRINSEKEYDKHYRQELMNNIAAQGKLNEQLKQQSVSAATEAESERYRIQMSGLTATRKAVEDGMKAIENTYKVVGLEGIETIKDSNRKVYEQYHDLFAKTVEIDAQIEDAKDQHKKKLEQITKDDNNRIKKNEIDTANEISNEQEKTFNNQIENLRDAQSKINEILSKQPQYNALGIVNVGATKRQYKEIEDAAKNMIQEIVVQQALLNIAFSRGLINPTAMNAIKSQFNDLLASYKQMLASIENETKQVMPQLIQSCQVYINGLMDAFNTIMNAVWDAQDVAFDKEQEQIEKTNEALENALDKQQEIVEQHKDAIDDIESELATARGDRRQHLIDQLNAEIAAQRAAQKEEQKIQKQKEAQQKKQDALELKRKKAQYNRDLLQAVVNGAMAVTYASMNTWPIPAIPMMALAAATTAAQVAIMAANKPYAKGGQLDGGVAQGKRHSEGGIPVLGGRASIEGGEFITNRQTTAKNVDLLEYINAKHRKLDIDDFIDFYSSGKSKKVITSMSPRHKYADGGQLPMLANDYNFDDRLLNAFEDYSNRPVVVSVVDINNKQEDVRRVQTLAGL